jgi:hypothetical protein
LLAAVVVEPQLELILVELAVKAVAVKVAALTQMALLDLPELQILVAVAVVIGKVQVAQ